MKLIKILSKQLLGHVSRRLHHTTSPVLAFKILFLAMMKVPLISMAVLASMVLIQDMMRVSVAVPPSYAGHGRHPAEGEDHYQSPRRPRHPVLCESVSCQNLKLSISK